MKVYLFKLRFALLVEAGTKRQTIRPKRKHPTKVGDELSLRTWAGTFLERSKRSGIVYMFRKLRPTIAITPHHPDGDLRVLCGLCLHPLGYYQESHAGAMVPTDDVIAHLVLMRGDEHRLWKQATQHAPYRHECGL